MKNIYCVFKKFPTNHLVRPNQWRAIFVDHPMQGRKCGFSTEKSAVEAMVWNKVHNGWKDDELKVSKAEYISGMADYREIR